MVFVLTYRYPVLLLWFSPWQSTQTTDLSVFNPAVLKEFAVHAVCIAITQYYLRPSSEIITIERNRSGPIRDTAQVI